MTKLLFKTKGNSEPGKKPRVYFSCLPEDFEETFEAVCQDIFKTQDCIIFYKEDMGDELPEETKETDLGRMNLFIFPVTFQMLRDENAPVGRELAYANRERKPVLPIMFEKSVSQTVLEFYGNRFGERQYLSKFSTDSTEISYEEKLKKYLESTLISDEMAERIRKAFDAYVFLSYRKKDRKYANELMRLIHADPTCRAIAIWFDEFLTPGESFNDSIAKALHDSKMVALLVTPSLLENDAKGNKNYVQRVEYPNARHSGKPILPTEKVFTDREALAADYEDLPEIVDANNEKCFHEEFLKAMGDVARREDDGDPMHDFLIGLAYLEGIDVEVNVGYGAELMTSAAESGLPEAMEKLYYMYKDGSNVPVSYQKSREWAEKLYHYYLARGGEEDPQTLRWMDLLTISCIRDGDFARATEFAEKCYQIRRKVLGEEHPDTLAALTDLGYSHEKLGDYAKAARIQEKSLEACRRILGEDHPDTLNSLSHLASIYVNYGDFQKALEVAELCHEKCCRVHGRDSYEAGEILLQVAAAYRYLGDYQKALASDQEMHEILCRTQGEEHPDAMATLNALAIDYRCLGEYQKELEAFQKCYEAMRGVLGEEHPDTVSYLSNVAVAYYDLGDYQKALEIDEKCYEKRSRILGGEHPLTLQSLNNVGAYHFMLGEYQKAMERLDVCYKLRCKVLGETHLETMNTLAALATALRGLGDYVKAKALLEKCYETSRRTYGEKNMATLSNLDCLACALFECGEKERAKKLFYELYEMLREDDDGQRQEELARYKEMLDQLPERENLQELEDAGERLIRKLPGLS